MIRMRFRRFIQSTMTFVAVAAITLTVVGCSSPKYVDLQAFVQAHNHDVVATTYRLEPPDSIRVASPTSPEVNGVHRIGSDGKVMLKLLGPVKVSTLTPKEVSVKLERLLSTYYVDPEVEVGVARYASKKIYVFGQVAKVGPRPFTGRDTVMNVLADAQPNIISWGGKVRVIRPSPDPEEVHELVVDVDAMMQSGDMRSNLLLQEGDIVYVPPTPLGWMGLRIQEVLFPLSPMLSAYTLPANMYGASNMYDNMDDLQYNYGYGGYGHAGQINPGGW